jgi:Pvc16 N-terminal domain/Carboxypeptidase regulatory-like domain
MFQDLDATLQALLDDPVAPAQLRNADASFETPDKNYTPGQASLNLFLHAVKENRELRDPEPIRVFENGQYKQRQPPMRVDCEYLVTTWSNQAGASKVEEEHLLLGLALGWLSRFGTIPETYLRGSLVGQPFPPPTLVAQMEGKQSLGDFWSALGIPPRPAFTVVVTIALDLAVEQVIGPEVVTHEVRLGADGGAFESAFLIAGLVRAQDSGALLVNASVTLQELERTVQTDSLGRYRFTGLAPGSYTLRTSAPGFQTRDTPVQVPSATAGAYHIVLVPV